MGVISPDLEHYLERPVVHPPPSHGTPRRPNLSIELETIVRAVGDAEVLGLGKIQSNCMVARYPVR